MGVTAFSTLFGLRGRGFGMGCDAATGFTSSSLGFLSITMGGLVEVPGFDLTGGGCLGTFGASLLISGGDSSTSVLLCLLWAGGRGGLLTFS